MVVVYVLIGAGLAGLCVLMASVRIIDPVRPVIDVQNYDDAVAQATRAALRSIIAQSDTVAVRGR